MRDAVTVSGNDSQLASQTSPERMRELRALSLAKRQRAVWSVDPETEQAVARYVNLVDAANDPQLRNASGKRPTPKVAAANICRVANDYSGTAYGYYWRFARANGAMDRMGLLDQKTGKRYSLLDRMAEQAAAATAQPTSDSSAPRIIIPLEDDFA